MATRGEDQKFPVDIMILKSIWILDPAKWLEPNTGGTRGPKNKTLGGTDTGYCNTEQNQKKSSIYEPELEKLNWLHNLEYATTPFVAMSSLPIHNSLPIKFCKHHYVTCSVIHGFV